MDRRTFVSGIIAVSALAQSPAPSASERESALRQRVEQFYTLLAAKKFRQGEALVAEDSKDYYYNGKKTDVSEFQVGAIQFGNDGRTARVTVNAKTKVLMGRAGLQTFDVAQVSDWKEENGSWVWYYNPNAVVETPFGPMRHADPQAAGGLPEQLTANRPTAESLAAQVTIDPANIVFGSSSATGTATITNNLPGGIDLALDDQASRISGLTVHLSKSHLDHGEKAEVKFEAAPGAVISNTVQVIVSPLGFELGIHLQTR
jgi:hypothetical protein